MGKHKIPNDLYIAVQEAVKNIYRYETLERYALNQVLKAGVKGEPVDDIFIKSAQASLTRYPVEHHRSVV